MKGVNNVEDRFLKIGENYAKEISEGYNIPCDEETGSAVCPKNVIGCQANRLR